MTDLESNILRGATLAEGMAEAAMTPPTPAPRRQTRGLVIALPIQRADLPALALIGLAGMLIGWWLWATTQPTGLLAGPDLAPGTWEPLLLSLFHQKSISLTLTLTIACLLVAAGLALSPLRWWAYLRFVAKTGVATQWQQFRRQSPEAEDAETWVAAQAAWQQEAQAIADQLLAAEAQSLPQSPDAPAPEEPTDQATAQSAESSTAAISATTPATEQAAVKPGADGQPLPTPSAPAEAPPTAPAAPAPTSATQPNAALKGGERSAELAALAKEPEEEALDLDDLTDVHEVLSSFADNDLISAELLALSATVTEVPLPVLLQLTERVASDLEYGTLRAVEQP